MAIELTQDYYLSNFIEVIDYAKRQYADLLCESEKKFHLRFHQLSLDAQRLFVRMTIRKGIIFRASKLTYQEISDTTAAALQLQNSDLITIDPELTPPDYVGLFNKSEWLKILAQLQLDSETLNQLKKLKRAGLNEVILSQENFDIYTMSQECFYQINAPEIFDTYRLLFFGNLRQNLTEFVLRDLGLFRFEGYVIDQQTRLFSNRQQIDSHLDFYAQIQDLDLKLSQSQEEIFQFHQALPDHHSDDAVLNHKLERTRLLLARQLERLGGLNEALQIYQTCETPPARERITRIFVKQDKIREALITCEEIISSPQDESEAVFGADFGYRTAKKNQIEWPRPKSTQPFSENLHLRQSGEGVEYDVALYLSQQGSCFYVENALFNSLFGLHFWDLFFVPIKGAFTNPFQTKPHDLYSRNFLQVRQALFEQLRDEVQSIQQVPQKYIQRWREKHGIATPFVYWDTVSELLIDTALDKIPMQHWQAVFDRIWLDIKANRAGFPDLVHFPVCGGYELIEVKGPGDRLQKNQLRWMQYFEECGIPHKVINVHWRK